MKTKLLAARSKCDFELAASVARPPVSGACPASTASTSLFDGAARVRGLLESTDRKVDSIVVYGGDEPHHRSTAALLPWARLHEHGMGIGVVG